MCAAADAAVRQNLVEELARRLYLRPRDIEERGRPPARRGQGGPAPSAAVGEIAPGERYLARILLECGPQWRARIVKIVVPQLITDARVRSLLIAASQLSEDPDGSSQDVVRELLRVCSDEAVESFVAELCNSQWPALTEESTRSQVRLIADRQSREMARRLAPMISSAEERGDHDEVSRLLAEKARLRRNLVKI